MTWVRTWLPVTIIASGLVLALATRFSETGFEGGTLLVAAGLSVWMINALYRFGARGERERDDEERARTFLDEHGYWPDEEPPAAEPNHAQHHRQPVRLLSRSPVALRTRRRQTGPRS